MKGVRNERLFTEEKEFFGKRTSFVIRMMFVMIREAPGDRGWLVLLG